MRDRYSIGTGHSGPPFSSLLEVLAFEAIIYHLSYGYVINLVGGTDPLGICSSGQKWAKMYYATTVQYIRRKTALGYKMDIQFKPDSWKKENF